ncbi:MAG: 1-deoxy-D-xylulose-5-phosphate reductoisomerase, partial [Bacteroidota bacterium]|nr:1-deoxy-D-xylulose-5-phosphate reductoisomerase [Candidatus Kapabacteria bacterium]MDW8219977.1 1-deoxy-D-xylulose-5-phosphate reductoisomerase [Bacteroidota bacterium]
SRTLSILGATGSIGVQTLDVVLARPQEFDINWLTVNTRYDLLEEQLRRLSRHGIVPRGVVLVNEQAYHEFRRITSFRGMILCGEAAVCEAASDPDNDIVLSALVGFSGVLPNYAAIQQGTSIALANKETLVSAGVVIMSEAKKRGVEIIPVDSEHSAILQCLVGEFHHEVEKLILTASGGPFREWTLEQLEHVTPAQALRHPNWSMGSKITIDSATLMNKGFEVIEAYWLFGVSADKIEVVVHPQSIIHSMVQFCDGSVKAQLGLPDMKIPIAYALSLPHRYPSNFKRMDICALQHLSFFPPDIVRFPCLRLAFDALTQGGSAPCIINAANEIAVAAFLQSRIGFLDIPRLIETCLEKITHVDNPTLDDIVYIDKKTRTLAEALIQSGAHVSALTVPVSSNGHRAGV